MPEDQAEIHVAKYLLALIGRLGCRVNCNSAERSWDCPCHGSRLAPSGEVLLGPAVRPLEPKPPG